VRNLNPTVRGIGLLVLLAAAITAAGAEEGVYWVLFVLRIAFIVAIAVFVYGLWRRRREEISTWSLRARAVFYVAAGTALANLLASFLLTYPETGLERLVFFAVFGLAGFAMWRVWRDEHTYG
jgi:fucose 4-O-acetylase-like acetyltransferase